MTKIKERIRQAALRAGYEIKAVEADPSVDRAAADIIRAVRPYTMTSPERLMASIDAVRYVHRYGVGGAIVECGVWAGGSSMAMARTLLEVGDTERELYLFDTFEGMSPATDVDVDPAGVKAADTMSAMDEPWCYAAIDQVSANMATTGYPTERVHLVKGMVEDTLPAHAPEQIAVLRLDTDFYESTRHELEHLLPRVAENGVLLIDDYGHWQGARRAVDEWIESCGFPVWLSRTDYTGRSAVIRRR